MRSHESTMGANGPLNLPAPITAGGISQSPQAKWEEGRTQGVPQKSNIQADRTTRGQSRHWATAGTKLVCSPQFAWCEGPGLSPKRKAMPQARITVLGQEGGLRCSSGLPHHTPNIPGSFNHQRKLWWPCKEVVFTLDSAPKHPKQAGPYSGKHHSKS